MPTEVMGVEFALVLVCLSVYLHNISKTDTAMITKLDMQMFHDNSCKSVYFISGLKVKVTGHKNKCRHGSLHSCECWLLPLL